MPPMPWWPAPGRRRTPREHTVRQGTSHRSRQRRAPVHERPASCSSRRAPGRPPPSPTSCRRGQAARGARRTRRGQAARGARRSRRGQAARGARRARRLARTLGTPRSIHPPPPRRSRLWAAARSRPGPCGPVRRASSSRSRAQGACPRPARDHRGCRSRSTTLVAAATARSRSRCPLACRPTCPSH